MLCWSRATHVARRHRGYRAMGLVVARQGGIIKAIVSVVVLQAASTIIQYCRFRDRRLENIPLRIHCYECWCCYLVVYTLIYKTAAMLPATCGGRELRDHTFTSQ